MDPPMETEAERQARKQKERASRRSGIKFEEVDPIYKVDQKIGAGTYGQVFKATRRSDNEVVAIKKCTDLFEVTENGKRILREVKLLKFFDQENVLKLKDIPVPVRPDFDAVFIVTEMMDFDLSAVLNSPQELAEEHFSYFFYQIVRGIKYIHSAGVIHRDLKPQNILVMENCDCKICDFGLSRAIEDEIDLTSYVVTRWYRAPELLLQQGTSVKGDYTGAIDVWSLGCILAEIIRRKVLFKADGSPQMLAAILDVLPLPTRDSFWAKPWVQNSRTLQQYRKQGLMPKTSLEEVFTPHFKDPENARCAIDLLEKTLRIDPEERPTAAECVQHPYFAHLHVSPECAPDAPKLFKWEHDDSKLTSEMLRKLFWDEIRELHPREALGENGPAPPAAAASASAEAPSQAPPPAGQ